MLGILYRRVRKQFSCSSSFSTDIIRVKSLGRYVIIHIIKGTNLNVRLFATWKIQTSQDVTFVENNFDSTSEESFLQLLQ